MIAWYDFKESAKASGADLINMKKLTEKQRKSMLQLLLVYDLLQSIMLVPKKSENWRENNLNPSSSVIENRMRELKITEVNYFNELLIAQLFNSVQIE